MGKVKSLLNGRLIHLVKRDGKKFTTPFFVFYFLKQKKREMVGKGRFVVVVSNRVSKRAVKRNRIRRRVKEVLYSRDLSFPPGVGVCIVRRNIIQVSQNMIQEDIERILSKIK